MNQTDDFDEAWEAANDIRYRAKCSVCGTRLGDWALKVKEPKCWKHRKWDVTKETKPFRVGLSGLAPAGK